MDRRSLRPLLGIGVALAVLAAVLALALWYRASAAPPANHAPAASRHLARVPPADAPASRTEVDTPARRPEPAPERAPRPHSPAPAPASFGTVELRAVDHASEAPLANFSWRSTGGVVPSEGHAEGRAATLQVSAGMPAAVHLEADGYARSLAVDVSLAPGQAFRTVLARLVRRVTDECLVVSVRDDLGHPVERVRVSAEHQPVGTRSEWTALWTREASAGDGRYAFGALEAGRYRLRLVALARDGRPRLLLPATRTLVFDGLTGVEQAVALEAAGSLVLSVRDQEGAWLGPGLTVRIARREGHALEARWVAAAGEPGTPGTAGSLPVAGPCELAEPVPPGEYVVTASAPGWSVERPVRVWAGQRTQLALP
jgi:hypothetical protein